MTIFAFIVGLWITRCHFDTTGVEVEWEASATNEPPYVVAVYPLSAAQFDERHRPLVHVVTDRTWARIEGDFMTHGGSFVQVFTRDILRDHRFRDALPAEVEGYRVGTDFRTGLNLSRDERDWLGVANDTFWLTMQRPDRSQGIPIVREVKSLSANSAGHIVAQDLFGCLCYARAPTNAVPGRIYFQGLQQGKEPNE